MKVYALLLAVAFVFAQRTGSLARIAAPAGQVDMGISLEPYILTLHPREHAVYNFRVENFSRETARNVTVTVHLSQGYRFEPMFYNSFWDSCTAVNATWPVVDVICTKKYFGSGAFSYVSIPAFAPDAGWPLPLTQWAAVGSDTPDYDAGNNWMTNKTGIGG